MIGPCLKSTVLLGGQRYLSLSRLRIVPLPGLIEDGFGTAADPRRALTTDRRFVSTNDDRGHAGRAA